MRPGDSPHCSPAWPSFGFILTPKSRSHRRAGLFSLHDPHWSTRGRRSLAQTPPVQRMWCPDRQAYAPGSASAVGVAPAPGAACALRAGQRVGPQKKLGLPYPKEGQRTWYPSTWAPGMVPCTAHAAQPLHALLLLERSTATPAPPRATSLPDGAS